MKEENYSDHITEEWLVEDVLQRYPSSSTIFLQHGSPIRTQPDRSFPDHVRVNLKEYADLRQVSIELLLRSLNAAAETEKLVRRNPWITEKRNEIEVSPGIYTRPGDF
jgi:hypothetical protein